MEESVQKCREFLTATFRADLNRRLKLILPFIITILLVNVSLAGTVAEPNLISWWKLDDGSGTTATDSAGSNNGTLQGNSQWTAGKKGGGIDLDGVNSYVEIADDDTLTPSNEITIAFWIYNKAGQDAGIYKFAACCSEPASPSNSRAYNVILRSATSLLQFTIFSSVSVYDSILSDNTIGTNSWHHIAATFNQGQANIYIDGLPDGSKTMSVSSIMNDGHPLIFGGYWDYCGTDNFA